MSMDQLLKKATEYDPVKSEGYKALNAVRDYLDRFISYPSDHALTAHTLWVAHTHLMAEWDSTPRLSVLSPEPGSGKSRVLEATEGLVPRPVTAVNATPAYLFRKVADPEGLPTILYDEVDTIFGPKARDNEEIRGLLNAGHRKSGIAGRCVVRGKEVFTEELSAYCAVALAGLGNLPDTITTRSVIIRMRRRAPGETVEQYRERKNLPEAHQIRDRLAAWATQAAGTLDYPDLPEQVVDRDADVWEPLIMVADAVGGEWPQLARDAAVYLISEGKESVDSLGVLLLKDLERVFAGMGAAMHTEQILDALNSDLCDESPWAEFKGEGLNTRQLARLLKPYGVHPTQVKVGGKSAKGYRREDLHDAWARYLPSDPPPATPEKGNLGNPGNPNDSEVTQVTQVTHLPEGKGSCPRCAGEGCDNCGGVL